MSLWHAFKPLKLELSGKEIEILNDFNVINYYPQKKLLMIDVSYYTGEKSKFLFFSFKEHKRINTKLDFELFSIKILAQGDEQTKQLKNAGGGALLGAVVAGPVGAAIGAYVGSRAKECPAIISIPSLELKINALAPIGYLKEQAQEDFFDNKCNK
jgi:hypothetical protein